MVIDIKPSRDKVAILYKNKWNPKNLGVACIVRAHSYYWNNNLPQLVQELAGELDEQKKKECIQIKNEQSEDNFEEK